MTVSEKYLKTCHRKKSKSMKKYIGMPYSAVPDPFGCHASYAEHYEKEYEESLEKIGLKFDIIRYQTREYMSGRYKRRNNNGTYKTEKKYMILCRNLRPRNIPPRKGKISIPCRFTATNAEKTPQKSPTCRRLQCCKL